MPSEKILSTIYVCSKQIKWLLKWGVLILPAATYAAGYQVDESSAQWLGMANAGQAAASDDVSSMFVNPATLASVKGKQFYMSSVLIVPKISYSNAQGTMSSDYNATRDVLGITHEGSISRATAVPNMAYGIELTPTISAGVSVTAPWGTFLEYNDASVLRNSAIKTSLQTVAVSPALSWKINDAWAVGAALNVMDSRAQYSNFIASIFSDPNQSQFFSDINMQGMGLGWTLGTIFQPTPSTRLGLSYRSYVSQSLLGSGFAVGYPVYLDTTSGGVASTTLPLPDVLTLGLSQQVTDKLLLGLSARYTRWSRVQTLKVSVTQVEGLEFSANPNWKNAWMLSAGGQYQVDKWLTLRAGLAYDQTPTHDATRDARSPDGDRIWGTLGASWAIDKHLSVNLSFAHIWIKDVSISTNEDGSMYFFPGQPQPIHEHVTAKANYHSVINDFGLGVRYTF